MTISKLLNSTDVHTVQRKVNEIIDEISTGVTLRNVEIIRENNRYCKTYDEYNSETGAFIGKWCEQGCYCDTTAHSSGYTQIVFIRSFRSTDYTFNVTPLLSEPETETDCTAMEIYPMRSFGGTKVYSNTDVYGYSWTACGYINSEIHDGILVKETSASISPDIEFYTADDEPYSVVG